METNQAILHDGYLIDPDTGEVLGLVEIEERWKPDTRAKAEWVLEKMQIADANAAAHELRKAAIIANLDGEIKKAKNRREYLNERFGPDLEEFALGELEGSKTKTYTTPFGKLSFRTVPGKWDVIDEAKAIEWAKREHPEAVKERLLISELKGVELPQFAFEAVPAREAFTINTGVKG